MLRELVAIYKDRFAVNVGSEPAAIQPFKIEVDDAKWSQRRPERYPRPQTRARQQAVHKFITKALADKVIRPSTAAYFSQVLLTPKANGSYRFCVDYRSLNAVTKNLRWPIPNIENLLRRIGTKKAKYFATLDYTSGYRQAPLEEQSKIYTAFTTSVGINELI
jgi:putative transposase